MPPMLDDAALSQLEKSHARGLTSAEILAVFAENELLLSEASLRKYVQLGLLPRSVRIGRKGKHQGSQGIYPVTVVRQILRIKAMMAQNYTIEQIRREFLFVRADLQLLEQTLGQIFTKLERVVKDRKSVSISQAMTRNISEARSLSRELLARLRSIESRLTATRPLDHAAAS
jgi:hypothetical protein